MARKLPISLRHAAPAHAARLHALIAASQKEGRLLPRSIEDLQRHAERFVVAIRGRKIVGCAELSPLSPHVAEVRSLAVERASRQRGIGTMLVEEVRRQARRQGFDKLCAFTHRPEFFLPLGFSIVPHLWLTEKVFTDCVKCAHFHHCGKFAMEVALDPAYEAVERPATIALRHV